MHHYIESGLSNVWLKNGFQEIQDQNYGLLLSIHDVASLDRVIIIDLLRYGEINGIELTFIRKTFAFSQDGLAKHLMLPTRELVSMELSDDVVEHSAKICDFFLSLLDVEGLQLSLEKPTILKYAYGDDGWESSK